MQSAVMPVPQPIPNPASPDPFARLAWLERQYEVVFQDASKQFAQNQQLLKEKQEWAANLDRISKDNETMLQSQNVMSKSLDSLERQKAAQNQRIQSLESENAQLKAKNAQLKKHKRESKEPRYTCFDCGSGLIISSRICGCCFVPAIEREGGSRGSTKISYSGWGGFTSSDVSDSEGGLKPDPFLSRSKEESWHRSIQSDTRLDEGAFDRLVEWCEDNIDRIETRRASERNKNGHEDRRLVQDLRDNREELEKRQQKLGKAMKARRQIKRRIRALTDDDPLVSENGLSLEKKLFVFCMVMGAPYYDFIRITYPFVKNEGEPVKINHQVMGAMQVLYHDLVEAPKAADPKFKHRNPSPAKWSVLQATSCPVGGPRSFLSPPEPDGNHLEQSCASNEKEARMACTALQNLLYRWQQDTLDGKVTILLATKTNEGLKRSYGL